MDVGQSVEIFVFVHWYIRLFILLFKWWIHYNDLSLKFFVLFLKSFLFTKFFFNSNYKLSFHFILWRKISYIIHRLLFAIIFILVLLFTVINRLLLTSMTFSNTLSFTNSFWLAIFYLRSGMGWLNRLLIWNLWFFRTRLLTRSSRWWVFRDILTSSFGSCKCFSFLFLFFLSDKLLCFSHHFLFLFSLSSVSCIPLFLFFILSVFNYSSWIWNIFHW